MPERDLTLRTKVLEADSAARSLGQISDAEDRVKKSAEGATTQAKNLNLGKEQLTKVLGQVSPQMAAYTDILADTADAADTLARTTFTLNDVTSLAEKVASKYGNALLALGAGGAAFVAIKQLLSAWRDIVAQEQEAIKLLKDFQEAQSKIAQQSQTEREQIATELNLAGRPVTDKGVAEIDARRRLLINAGFDPSFAIQQAVGEATGEAVPLTQRQIDTQRRFVETPIDTAKKAKVQALQFLPAESTINALTGGLADKRVVGTGDQRAFEKILAEEITDQAQRDEVRRRIGLIVTGQKKLDPGTFVGPGDVTPAVEAAVLQVLGRLGLNPDEIFGASPGTVGIKRERAATKLQQESFIARAILGPPEPEEISATNTVPPTQTVRSGGLSEREALERLMAPAFRLLNEAASNLNKVATKFANSTGGNGFNAIPSAAAAEGRE